MRDIGAPSSLSSPVANDVLEKRGMTKSILFGTLVCSAIMLSACTAETPESDGVKAIGQDNGTAGDTHAIRLASERWLELIREKNASAIAQLYAEDGALMPPNSPMAKGHRDIQSAWQSMMQVPGFDLTFKPETIVVSSSGDMALDRGTYDLTMNPPGGPVRDNGKYVVVWRKIDGEWKAAADIFNSNQPPSP